MNDFNYFMLRIAILSEAERFFFHTQDFKPIRVALSNYIFCGSYNFKSNQLRASKRTASYLNMLPLEIVFISHIGVEPASEFRLRKLNFAFLVVLFNSIFKPFE